MSQTSLQNAPESILGPALGMDEAIERMRALVQETPKLEPHGTNQWASASGEEKSGHADSSIIYSSTGQKYLIARLKRDAPKIAARLAAGEFRSARAAAIEAGIVKPKTGLAILRSGWRKATKEEREIFKKETE